ncbi:unnamed protein product, partial [Prorocentrum cordatum]
VFGAFLDDVVSLQWKQASKHVAGGDLEQGADLLAAQIELNRMVKKSMYVEWASNLVVVAGGQWTRDRQIAAGYACPPLCPAA